MRSGPPPDLTNHGTPTPMYFPQWLYQMLPVLYTAIALFLLLTLKFTALVGMSIALLLGAAALTFHWRRRAARSRVRMTGSYR